MIDLADIEAARERIGDRVHRTPTVRSSTLSEQFGTNVYLKLELLQKTGCFKPRGAFNQLMALIDETGAERFVGVSGGNFAQGLAYAATALGVTATVVMPEGAPAGSIAATRGYGADVELVPDVTAAFDRADELASGGVVQAHPFDHPAMMAGNGGVGLELVDDVPDVTDVYISVGGGGFITGIGSAVRGLRPSARLHAVETDGAHVMALSLAEGAPARMQPTSISKTLGSPYLAGAAYTFAVEHLEDATVVTDQAAFEALVFLLERVKVLPEIAASCTLAALREHADRYGPDDHVVLVLCGGNVSADDLAGYREHFGDG